MLSNWYIVINYVINCFPPSGHRSCIANVGTTDQALEALYELQVDNNGLHNGGQHQPYNSQIAMWSEVGASPIKTVFNKINFLFFKDIVCVCVLDHY